MLLSLSDLLEDRNKVGSLQKFRNSCYFPTRVRSVFSDFAVMLAIVIMTVIDFLVGIDTPKLNVPDEIVVRFSYSMKWTRKLLPPIENAGAVS